MLPFEHVVAQKVNIKLFREFDVENISVKLQHDPCNSLGVIVFTGKLTLNKFESSKRTHKGHYRTPPIC